MQAGSAQRNGAVPAVVDFCEPLGSHVLVHTLVPTEGEPARVVAQAPPGVFFDPGAAVSLSLAPEKTYLFDADTGSAVGSRERIVLG
ncbi:TOBE domain-containing protein [Mycolicibacterium sp. CBM1]